MLGYEYCVRCDKYADDGEVTREGWLCLDCSEKREMARELINLLLKKRGVRK